MPALAQVPTLGEILKIEVRLAGAPPGVDENFVRSHIRLKVGDTYRPGLENEDVKALVATGRISNVLVQSHGLHGGGNDFFNLFAAQILSAALLELPARSSF